MNFKPERNVFLEVAGVIVSTTRTNPDGRFSAQIFMPISGEGAHTVRAIEESGNVASSSFFMDFGFDNIQETTEKIDKLTASLDFLNGDDTSSNSLSEEIKNLRESISHIQSEAEPSEDNSPSTLVKLQIGRARV